MSLNDSQYYICESHEDKISFIEEIYNHNPRLMMSGLYLNRLESVSFEFPVIRIYYGPTVGFFIGCVKTPYDGDFEVDRTTLIRKLTGKTIFKHKFV